MQRSLNPTLKMLGDGTIQTVIDRACDIFEHIGVRVTNKECLDILNQHGASVDMNTQTVRIKCDLVETALGTVPAEIDMFDENGKKSITLGGANISFSPGGSASFILDTQTGRSRKAVTSDMVRFVRLVDSLEHLHHNHPGLILSDIPAGFIGAYRYYVTLLNTSKPISGGMASGTAIHVVKEMLSVIAGGEAESRKKPRISCACCPTSPLTWDDEPCQNIIDCARYAIPARLVPAPIAGATSPVTLLGTILQHTVENLCGVVIHQLTNPGAPVFWGAGTTVMDMRSGICLFGAIESQMMKMATAQIGKTLGMATYAIAAFGESMGVDAQAGIESTCGILPGVLAGINMVGGVGMLESGLCHSLEKVVVDSEICAMATRMASGISCNEDSLAYDILKAVGPGGNYLTTEHTREWMKKEHTFPSEVISRCSRSRFDMDGDRDTYQMAKEVVRKILDGCESRPFSKEKKRELEKIISLEGKRCGMDRLPDLQLKRI